VGRRSVHSPEELRQLILDASRTIVERNGISGLSAREIARMIGYSPGTLYNIFENLDDVLLTMQVQLLARMVDHLKHVPIGSDGEENVDVMTQAYINFALANRRMWNLLFAHSVPSSSTVPPPFHEHLNNLAEIVRKALAPLAPGATLEELDTAARALFAGVHGIAAIAASEKGAHLTPASAQVYAKELTSNFVRGFRLRWEQR
jgi:AcrR family transcriptional regulator